MMTLTGMHISHMSEAYYGGAVPEYTQLASIKGNRYYHDGHKSLFIVDIYKDIEQINEFFDRHNHLIKQVDIKILHNRMYLFIYKRKRLGRTDVWSERELELLRKYKTTEGNETRWLK